MVDQVADAFGIDPDRAKMLDYELALRVLDSRAARQMYGDHKAKRELTPAQARQLNALMDALDERDEAAGKPSEQ